jgi:RNA polymerase sigma factor (sigma-70 family)
MVLRRDAHRRVRQDGSRLPVLLIVNETKFVNFPVSGMEAKFTALTVEELVSKHTGLLKTIGYTMGKTYRLSREDQEDIVSAIRFRLVANYKKIDFTRADVAGYIRVMINNTARTELQRILRHRSTLVPLPEGEEQKIPDVLLAPETSLDTISNRAICEEVKATMNSKHRKMVEMFMAGITTKEIAERVCHKNGRPYTAPTVAYILAGFRDKVRKRVKN